jgi:non-ribosomal peptide synthetase component F
MLDDLPTTSADHKVLANGLGQAKPWGAACVHECFERLADQQPEAPAVVTDEGVLTYADLDRRANALAHALLALDLRPEEPVGVLTDRSASLPLAFLALLKAGAVYVPMVADLPPQRLANMAGQSGMRLVIALDGLVPPAELLEALAANAASGTPHGVLRPEELPEDPWRAGRVWRIVRRRRPASRPSSSRPDRRASPRAS